MHSIICLNSRYVYATDRSQAVVLMFVDFCMFFFWLQPFLDILWFWVTLFLNLIWDHLTRGRGDWSVCWSTTGRLWFHFFLLLLFSVCQRRAAVFDCGTPWESFHC